MARKKASGVERIGEGRYRIRVDVACPRTGRRLDVKRIVHAASATDAARQREDLRAEMRSGSTARSARARLGDALPSWLASIAPALKRSTAELYALVLDRHVIPVLGEYYVDALTRDDLVALRDGWVAAGASPATVNGRMRILRQALGAICDEVGVADPSRRIRGVRTPPRAVPKGLEPAQVGAVLRELEGAGTAVYSLALMLATTGLRWGECTALLWSDIDLDRCEARIVRAHVRGHVDTPKTGTSKTVPLAAPVVDALRLHRAEMVRTQAPGLSTGLVWPSSVGTHRQPSSLRKRLAAACEAAEVPVISPHGLRHSMNHAARRVAADETVRAITGHVTQEMTAHYDWVTPSEKRAAVGEVVRLFGLAGTSDETSSGSGTKSGTSAAGKDSAG